VAKALHIAANNTSLFVLADDGRIWQRQIAQGTWVELALPAGVVPRERLVQTEVIHNNMPKGYKLWRDGETALWRWTKGSEESAVFGREFDAISDARQKHLISKTLPK
jgi:hypothetical protein